MKLDELHNDLVKDFEDLARKQRGDPESAMLKIQRLASGGVYPFVVEHVGDLIHRMAQNPEYNNKRNEGIVKDKVEKTLRTLTNAYGFEKEMYENFENNFNYQKENNKSFKYNSVEEYINAIKKLGEDYAKEHAKLPVYNLPQWLSREAAVALGKMNFRRTINMLKTLKHLIDSGKYIEEASSYKKNYKP